jgi:hypothetical protein
MPEWTSINDRLPPERTLVWIHVEYEDSPYDNVKERVSIGSMYKDGRWEDLLDFPFADDYTVTHWMLIEFPESP